MDRRRTTRLALIGAAALTVSACAQQQSNIAAVSRTNSFAYTAADRECLARAMYFESNRSSSDGMLAVGSIVANRVQSGRYGTTVCQVVGGKRQFAPGVMTRTMSGPSADLARATADQVLAGKRHPGVKSAMHFHTAGMRFRYPNMHYVLVAGGNAFYEKRDSSGGGAASNARSLALALAHAKADSQPIQVAAATPLEQPIAPAVSTYSGGVVTVTAKSTAPAAIVTTTQVASAVPAAAPAGKAAVHPAPGAQPIAVASAAPAQAPASAAAFTAAASSKRTVQPQPVVVASAAPVAAAAPEASRQQQVARSAQPKAERPAVAPVAYAEAAGPAVELPKVRPAPKRVIKVDQSEPALASVAPAASPKKARPAKAEPVAAAEPAAPATVAAAEPSPNYSPVAARNVASAFDAFR